MHHEERNTFLHPALAALSVWIDPALRCADKGDQLELHLSEALKYHGFDAPGGVVLGFRLLQKALACLAPDEAWPDRRQMTLFTSFPGLGLKDTMEAMARMVSDGRYRVDANHHDGRAQEGVCGDLYFRFGYKGRVVELAPVEGYPDSEFVRLGRASKSPGFTGEQAAAWRKAKFDLANTLLASAADTVIRVL